uniref:Uncharacterized protein n=1 Tax=Tetradesmus obliquus TaxID=3088 RepID=A0A383VCK2_TETOB|eukprot:jgi/Sobl393_1/5662/SZX62901.1
MMAIAVFCFSNVGLILLHKQLTSLGSTDEERKDLVALDFRKEGYTAADVESLLSKYGPEGRTTYALYEALDLAVFMWSYAAVLSMMLSVTAAVAPFEVLKLANLLPWAAAAADAVENSIILAMLATYPQHVAAVAPLAVTASAAKWTLLSLTASTVAGLGFYCLYAAAKQASRPKQQQQRQQGQQQQGQAARSQQKKQR